MELLTHHTFRYNRFMLSRIPPPLKATLLLVAIVGLIKWLRFYNIQLSFYDLYYFDHSIWSTAQGRLLFLDQFGKSYFADHFYPYLLLLAPLYKIIPSPLWIFAVFSISIGFLLYPILRLAFEKFGHRGVWLTSILLMGNYTFRNGLYHDLHGDILMGAFISWIIYYMIKERPLKVFLLAVFLPFCKETGGLFLLFIAGWLGFIKYRWGLALTTLFYGLGIFEGTTKWFIPLFNTESYRHLARYSHLGHSTRDILLAILTPWKLLPALLNGPNIAYLLGLSLPLAGLPFLSGYSIFSIFFLAQNLLSNVTTNKDLGAHYNLPLIPILAISSILVLSHLYKHQKKRLITAFWILSWTFLSLNGLVFLSMEARTLIPTAHARSARKAFKLIPKNAPIAAHSKLYAYLHYRRDIDLFPPRREFTADYILVEDRYPKLAKNQSETELLKMWGRTDKPALLKYLFMGPSGYDHELELQEFAPSKDFQLIFNENRIRVFKRKPNP